MVLSGFNEGDLTFYLLIYEGVGSRTCYLDFEASHDQIQSCSLDLCQLFKVHGSTWRTCSSLCFDFRLQ